MSIPREYEHIPWSLILKISREYNVCAYLIAAIGQHETGWGKLVDHELYTGYGAFDHAFDHRFAGEERQIRGTARMMREWGMTPNRVTLERLRRGNSGEFGRIYATDPLWPDKVWRHYQRIKNSVDLKNIAPAELDVKEVKKVEVEKDEIEFEEEGWEFHVLRILAISLLVLVIILAVFWSIFKAIR